MLDVTEYTIHQPIQTPLQLAIVADLHNEPFDEIIKELHHHPIDLITVPGDLYDSGNGARDKALAFLRAAVKIAPTFYTFGNHECRAETDLTEIKSTGCKLLNNEQIWLDSLLIGGLSSKIDLDWLEQFSAQECWKLLLCHHPEYYKKHLRQLSIDLIVSGHAHGGHIRIGNRAVFAIGQGPLPKYTSGVHENRLVVSRGLGNQTFIPRMRNHPELVFVKILPNLC